MAVERGGGSRRSGVFEAARSFLDRVIDRVRDALPGAREGEGPPGRDEPIVTRTMAGLLVAQGHDERALAIYEQLLLRSPDDRALRAESDALRRRIAGRSAGERVDPVVAVETRDRRVLVSWQLDDAAVTRARGVLGTTGTLAARVVVVRARGGAEVETEILERRGLTRSGEWVTDRVASGARCACAVGLLDGDRFVSAGHARIVRVS